jgi:salicylate hydroxylase
MGFSLQQTSDPWGRSTCYASIHVARYVVSFAAPFSRSIIEFAIGAAMAVEDAAALATALEDTRGEGDLARVLRVFEEVRSERTRQMQQASSLNAQLLHFADGPEQQARDAAMEAEVLGLHFETSSNQWSDPMTQRWAYGYDAVSVIQQRLWASRN